MSLLLLALGCVNPSNPDEENEEELITTVILEATDASGGVISATWEDLESDGNPTVDDLILMDGVDYTLSVRFLNNLEDPAEEITTEVQEEGDHHQLFFTGNAVEGAATGENPDAVITQEYADADEDGLPIGLENNISAVLEGSETLMVTLQHLPDQDGVAVKVAGLEDDVAAGSLSDLPGSSDVQVEFTVEVASAPQ